MVGEIDSQSESTTVHQVRVRTDATESLSTRVAEAVATAAGVDSTSTDVRLYDVIDTDALDTLHRHARDADGTWELAFDAAGHGVVVTSDGTVTVR